MEDDSASQRLHGLSFDRKPAPAWLSRQEIACKTGRAPLHRGDLRSDQLRMGSWFCDLVSNAHLWSDELYRILNLQDARVEPTAEAFFAVLHADDRERVGRYILRAMQGEQSLEAIDFRVGQLEDSIRYVRLTSAVTFDAEGRHVHWIGVLLDVTDSIREAALSAETNDELRIAQRVARMGSYTVDGPSLKSTWSTTLLELLEVAPTETPSTELFFQRVHPDDRLFARATLEQILATGVGVTLELRMQRKDGTLWHAYADSLPERRPDGTLILRGVLQDVTLRRAEQERLRHTEKMVAIGTLAGGVAHDFNNYLAVLMGEVALLQKMPVEDPRVQRSLNAVHAAADRCAKLTGQLLTLASKRELRLERLDLRQLIERAEPMLHSVFSSQHHELIVEHCSESVIVQADPVELEQALLNLAINARDAMPKGGRFVLSVVVHDASNGRGKKRQALIIACDTGIGMDSATVSRIFEPFFSTKAVGKGTGLGLATVYGLMQRIGGHVDVQSELGRGTTFRLVLPLADAIALDGASVEIDQAAEPAMKTILVVDDVEALRRVICEQLIVAGYQVEAAANGREALDFLASTTKRIDLVLSDVVMPVLGGLELQRELHDHYPQIGCLLMTGYSAELAGLPIRALRKPFTIQQLQTALRELERRGPGEERAHGG